MTDPQDCTRDPCRHSSFVTSLANVREIIYVAAPLEQSSAKITEARGIVFPSSRSLRQRLSSHGDNTMASSKHTRSLKVQTGIARGKFGSRE